MPSVEVYDAVRAYVQSSFSDCPVAWENERFRTNDSINAYALASIVGTYYTQESIGSGDPMTDRWDEGGLVVFYVLTREGSGTRESHRLGGLLANLFRGATLLDGELQFLSVSIGGGEKATVEGSWWMMPVEIEFRRMNETYDD